ncbi:MAG: HD domain-containing protein [Gemmatales bacterium]|nr:HD domain-containing protein [Gemmatales bacterium]MDW8223930.1 HD domain-containing protein [Gemmatales bacterium]
MPRIRLKAVSPQWEGQFWESTETLRVGRLEGQEVVINDPSVSRRHAEIHYTNQGWMVRDLGSTNGTYLNGVRVGMVERKLRPRDLLQCGNVLFLAVLVEEDTPRFPVETPSKNLLVESSTQRTWDQALQVLANSWSDKPKAGDRFLTLLRASYHLTRIESPENLLRAILEDAVRALDAQRAAIVLWDDKECRLVIKAVSTGERELSSRAWYSSSLAQRCFQQGESLLCRDARILGELQASSSIMEGAMSSIICAVLRSPRKKLGVLHLDRHFSQQPFTDEDLRLADALAATVSASIECAQLLEKQREMFVQTVTALAQAVEMRDPYTGGHTLRVTEYALMLADALQLTPEKRRILEIGTPLHDIGKIGIDDHILRKAGPLTPEEFEIMKSHTVKGTAILETLPDLKPYIPIVRHHHERWDGTGYPDGLKGEEIDLLPRIVALADAFDAMTSNRPYRPGMPPDLAFQQIRKHAGTQFDPQLAEVFLKLRPQILEKMWLRNNAIMDTLLPAEIHAVLQNQTTTHMRTEAAGA